MSLADKKAMWLVLLVFWLSQEVSLLTLSENAVSFALNLSLHPAVPSARVCPGALKVDALDAGQLLVGVCSSSNSNYSGGIGFLSLRTPSDPLLVVYGNISASSTNLRDGIGHAAGIVSPQHLYQTSDGKRILFVDNNSCAREVDRSSGNVSTVIGSGSCLTHTLDMNLSSSLVSGMTYVETSDAWIFSLRNHGVFMYRMDTTGNYSGELLVALEDLSIFLPVVSGQLCGRGDIWHKVSHGINRYTLCAVNSTAQASNDSVTLVRYVSSAGPGKSVDPTALYQYSDEDLRLGAGDASLELSPDGNTLLVIDQSLERIFLLHTHNGSLEPVCLAAASTTACTFPEVTTAAWLDDSTLLVGESDSTQLRRFELAKVRSSTVNIHVTSTRPSTNDKIEESTWWIVLAIVCGFCSPLLIFWIAIKVVQIRRHGLVFDIFSEEDDSLDPIAARKVNFLYNKAARGEKYERKDNSNLNELQKVKSMKRKSKSADEKKRGKVPIALESAARSISEKFRLPKRKKKKVSADGMDDELYPIPKKSSRTKARKQKRESVDINFMGSTVSVPMTKTLVGRARPLPPLPINETI